VLAAVVAAEFIQAAAQAYRTIHMQMAARQAVQNFANADAQDREILARRAAGGVRGVQHDFNSGRLIGGGRPGRPRGASGRIPGIANMLDANIVQGLVSGFGRYMAMEYRVSIYRAIYNSVPSLTNIARDYPNEANAIATALVAAYRNGGNQLLTDGRAIRQIFRTYGLESHENLMLQRARERYWRQIASLAAPAPALPAIAPAPLGPAPAAAAAPAPAMQALVPAPLGPAPAAAAGPASDDWEDDFWEGLANVPPPP